MRKTETNTRKRWRRTTRRLAAFLILVALTVTGTTLLLPGDSERCLVWQERPLANTHMTPAMLRAVRAGTPIHEAPGLLSAGLFPPGFGGLALPDRIVLSSRLGDEIHHADREHLIWHEIVHVEQMRQEGVARFALVYTTDWIRGRWSGCGAFSSYEAIRYEREADLYAVAMDVAEWARTTNHPRRTAQTRKHADTETSSNTPILDAALDANVGLARIVEALLDAGFE